MTPAGVELGMKIIGDGGGGGFKGRLQDKGPGEDITEIEENL